MCSDQNRYSRRMILAHWLSVLMVLLLLICGFWMVRLPSGELKLSVYQMHVFMGYALLLLVLLRLYFRWRDSIPPPTSGIGPRQQQAARLSHWLLYALLVLLPVTGFWMVAQSALPEAFLTQEPHRIPDELATEWSARVHWFLSLGLIALVLLHLGAVVYHEWIQGERVLGRIWLRGRRRPF